MCRSGKPTGNSAKLERSAFAHYWPLCATSDGPVVNQKCREFGLMILSILIYPIYTAPQTRRRIAPALAMAVSARLVHRPVRSFLSGRARPTSLSSAPIPSEVLAAAVGLFIITWTTGFRRHYRRTLESEDTRPRIGSNRRSNRLVRSPETGDHKERDKDGALFFRARFSIPGRTRFQLALPHYRSAMGGNLAQRHS